MAAKKRSGKTPASSLEAKQAALREEQEKLRIKMERLQRMLDDAPKLQEQNRKRRRDQFVNSPVRASDRVDTPILSDKRYKVDAVSQPRKRRALKAEQRQARLTFLGLFCGFLLLLVWLYSVWRW